MTTPNKAISFCKMQALGNDFVVIDQDRNAFELSQLNIPKLAHRQLGIGFDQLLLIKSLDSKTIQCRIFNADGSEAEQCGNGLRCVGYYCYKNKIVNTPTFHINTIAGQFDVDASDRNTVILSMGKPNFLSESLSFASKENKDSFDLTILSLGNPHAILTVTSLNQFPVATFGKEISTHELFPQQTNVGFMEIVTPKKIRLRTYERGVGETLSCGSNACAAVASGIHKGMLEDQVDIDLLHGQLTVAWPDKQGPVYLSGPAEEVFSGIFIPD